MAGIPETITILSISAGLISFIVSQRNNIQVIHDDIDTIVNFKEYLSNLLAKLREYEKQLEDWKTQWMVWDPEPGEPLLRFFWGDYGWQDIFECLQRIDTFCNKSKSSLDKLSGLGGRWKITQRKFLFTTMKQKAIRGFLADLGAEIGDLNRKADREFINLQETQPSRENIYGLGDAFNLARLSIATWHVSNDLLQSCETAMTDIQMDLDLNFFDADVNNSTIHSRHISALAATTKLMYTFLSKKQEPGIPAVRTILETLPQLNNEPCYVALTLAFNDILDPNKKAANFEHTGGARFQIRQVENPALPPGLTAEESAAVNGFAPSQSLRSVLSTLNTRPLDEFYRVQEHRRKMKLALQIAQCGLLFLGSNWLHKLCSCRLLQRGSDKLGYTYLIRGGLDSHTAPQWPDFEQQNWCWCKTDFPQDMRHLNLRYVGVLLTEIALGYPVYDVVPYRAGLNSYAATNVSFYPKQRMESLAEIMSRLQDASSRTYAEAVEYCLRSSLSCDQLMNQEHQEKTRYLSQYHTNVFTPISTIYKQSRDRLVDRVL